MSRPIFIAVLLFTLFGCSQDPVDPNIILVPDNTAPPDLTVPRVIQENYINKLYITLLGRKVTETELDAALVILDQDFTSIENRKELIQKIQSEENYYYKQYDFMRINILSNLDTADISTQIRIYVDLLNDPQYADFYDLIELEINKLVTLRDAPQEYAAKTIGRIALHKACVNNPFYDEINMGSQNFVLAMFEFFLGRNPTTAEEKSSISMVDGIESVVFGEIGQSKADFIDIFFRSNNYFEGQVFEIYRNFLFRDPNTVEMSNATKDYKLTLDYQLLMQDILSTDEYLGID
ncbi:MAG: hypothetical protein AAFY71_21365 [Bacteroidota bacterium]